MSYEKKYLERCKTTQGDKHRDCFGSEDDAARRAEVLLHKYDNALVPYHCGSCGEWHLSPQDRHTPSSTCLACTDREGVSKQLYSTQGIARKRADIILAEKGIVLQIYPCPNSDGWHLTKG